MESITNHDERRQLLVAIRNGDLPCERSTALWTPEERAELEEAYRNGVGISDLSLRLQRSETAVYQQLVVMGLTATSGIRGPKKPRPNKCECPRCLETQCPHYDAKGGICRA